MKWSTLVESGKGVVSNATKVISRNRVSILVGLGTMSTITAIVTAVRATPKAMNAIEDKRVEVNRYELTNKETICATAKYYIPTVLSTAAAVTCFATAVNFSDKKAAAATLAATTAQISLDEYRAQAKQAWGEEGAKKDAEIMNSIATKQVEQTYSQAVPQNEKLDGDVLCLDRQTGAYFYSTKNRIDAAVNTVNRSLNESEWVYCNDFYSDIGEKSNGLGWYMGWSPDKGTGKLDVEYSSILSADGTMIMCIDYRMYEID